MEQWTWWTCEKIDAWYEHVFREMGLFDQPWARPHVIHEYVKTGWAEQPQAIG